MMMLASRFVKRATLVPSVHRSCAAAIAYKAPVREIDFIINKVFNFEEHYKKMGATDASPDLVEGILNECAKFGEEELAPLYEVGDRVGCKLENGIVTTPPGFKEAYNKYVESGWQSMTSPEEYGGQSLPLSLGLIKTEIFCTANWAWNMFPGLSLGCMNTLILHASEEQKQMYLPKLSDGTWTGTMCLTEPHCGSDLGQVRTSATPQDDGTYRINGTKIFISCGDHDFTENIVHIVLARLPNSPPGTKGISLFLVPRNIVQADGSVAQEKNVQCGSIENKMGIHGSPTAVLNFDNSVGYIIGEPNTGLHQMFTFMNTARLGTAMQGIAHAELAYQNSLPYAKERMSMRALSGTKCPDKVADTLINHPDVRRQLLTQKCFIEASRAMLYHVAMTADKTLDKATMKQAEDDMGLLTPIMKGFMTEMGLESVNQGLQVWGGHGYIKDNGLEQICRDARISTVWEGTTGIQGLDLLGRKIAMNKGAPLFKWTKEVGQHAFSLLSGSLRSHSWAVVKTCLKVNLVTARILANAASNRDAIGAASVDYLMLCGYLALGHYWLRIEDVCLKELSKNPSDPEFYKAKLETADFYFTRIFPRTLAHIEAIKAGPQVLTKMKEENF